MADLKVKLQFDDPAGTSFTYDKANGLKSFSFMTEAKSSAETLDYSVKSNAGSFSAKDIVAPEGEFYVKEFMNSFTSSEYVEDAEFGGAYYNSNDGYFYLCNRSIGYNYIYRTVDFVTYEWVQYPYTEKMQFDKITKYNDCFLCTGVVSVDGVNRCGYIYYNSNNELIVKALNTSITSSGIGSEELKTKCLKEVNGKLFISVGEYVGNNNYYLDSIDSEPIELDFGFPSGSRRYYEYMYDVIYENGKYIFLTKYGIYTSSDLINFVCENNIEQYSDTTTGSIMLKNGNYYVTCGNYTTGVFSGKNLTSLTRVHSDILKNIIKFYKYENVFLLISKDNSIYYTSDFKNIYDATKTYSNPDVFYDIVNNDENIIILGNNDSIVKSPQIESSLVLYSSLYEWLLTKPEYSTITIDATLDGRTLGNFVNNGKIEYDNDTKELNLQIRNPLIILQNITYKMQFNKNNSGSMNLFDVLNDLVVLFDSPDWKGSEISQTTKTYLESVKVKYPYLEGATIWEQLNKICEVGQLVIYPSSTKLKIERWV